jgi:hypothetical protein
MKFHLTRSSNKNVEQDSPSVPPLKLITTECLETKLCFAYDFHKVLSLQDQNDNRSQPVGAILGNGSHG